MPSIIPGYEYDIFISYRQKDNKGERWVSEFVDALKTELGGYIQRGDQCYFDEIPMTVFRKLIMWTPPWRRN